MKKKVKKVKAKVALDGASLGLLSNIVVNRPTPGGLVLENARQITVRATGVASDVAIHACVQVAGFLPPIPAPNGTPDAFFFTALTSQGSGVFQGDVTVPSNHSCSVGIPAFDNLTVTTIVKHSDNLWDQTPKQTSCKGVCPTMVVDVPATACPWFAYADEGLTGPAGEPVRIHKPVRLKIPEGASNVAFTAVGTWRHAPNNPSGPDGTGSPFSLINGAYRSTFYGSNVITGGSFKVNTLVGMFEPDNTIFQIGSTLGSQSVGTNTAIHFGFWDGTQWNGDISNSGSVSVSVTWS